MIGQVCPAVGEVPALFIVAAVLAFFTPCGESAH